MTPTKSVFIATAHTLDANHAPLALVQDFADQFAEQNPRFNRVLFVTAATKNLRADLVSDLAALDRATGKV